jgi:hypothetical protein
VNPWVPAPRPFTHCLRPQYSVCIAALGQITLRQSVMIAVTEVIIDVVVVIVIVIVIIIIIIITIIIIIIIIIIITTTTTTTTQTDTTCKTIAQPA